MISFDFVVRPRTIFGAGTFDQLGTVARSLGFSRALLVADSGVRDAGYVARAVALLEAAGVTAIPFHDFGENPDSAMVESGRAFAAPLGIDSLIGLGGGSSLDCAKGINFLLTNGGTMADYRGYAKVTSPLLPMIGVPTTAGTGSEAQSYAVISDAATHMKMACGDPSAAVKVAILDPELTLTAPRGVTATSGFDAIAHAVETAVTTKRTPVSEMFAHRAWSLLSDAFPVVMENPGDLEARSAMLAGSHFAGIAIEQSMLGAAHACANPLTARFGMPHGIALAALLPHVVRFNGSVAADLYAPLVQPSWVARHRVVDRLVERLETLITAGGLTGTLRDRGIDEASLPELANLAAQQWTGTFNPRPFDAAGALEIYWAAY